MATENSNNNFQGLKAKREALGLSLKDVFRRTRVSVAYLEAIENGDFHLLPESIYAQNFIKSYARVLDMDSKLIIAGYEEYLNSLNILENLPPEDVPDKVSFFTKIAHYGPFWGIISILIVIAFVMWLISMQYRPATEIMNDSIGKVSVSVENKEQIVNTPVNTSSSINEQTTANLNPVVTNPEQQAQVASPGGNNTAKPPAEDERPAANEEVSRLIIRATEETWIKIKTDQNPISQVFLKPGEKIEYEAARFDIDIGNAAGIKIKFRGKEIENLGKSGQVIRLRLP
jgi:cytoskeletal protein RodZ